MSGHESRPPSLIDRIRRWLRLDHAQRTDKSEANRGFYPGGMPVYLNRKPVGRRFVLPVVAVGVVIALVILATRGAAAQSTEGGQRLVFEESGFAITAPVDRAVGSGAFTYSPTGSTDQPPSTVRVWPVTARASGESR